PYNTVVPGADEPSGDFDIDQPGVSEWSGYGSFTVYHSILDRISKTRHVRVGTNLEQNTQFARRKDGEPWGFDIALVKGLVEGCIEIRNHTFVAKSDQDCNAFLARQRAALQPPPPANARPAGTPKRTDLEDYEKQQCPLPQNPSDPVRL